MGDDPEAKILPSALQPLVATIEFASMPRYMGPRNEPAEGTAHEGVATHIVVIMDESVRADYLQINGFPHQTTPFLASLGPDLLNYGIVSSTTNLTYTSNYALMTGLRQSELPDFKQVSRKGPTIFQYAEGAGRKAHMIYTSMHISDFAFFGSLFSGVTMRPDWVMGQREDLVDGILLDKLVEITSSATPSFSWVNKRGCHFPYVAGYPPSVRAQLWLNSNAENDFTDRELEYISCIRWQVDHFFSLLNQKLQGRSVVVVYTADHGQTLRLSSGKVPHGQVYNPGMEQAAVPLLLLGLNQESRNFLQQMSADSNRENLSASQIFPSLLYLMGYPPSTVELYDRHLFQKLALPRRSFLSGDLWGMGTYYVHDFTWNE